LIVELIKNKNVFIRIKLVYPNCRHCNGERTRPLLCQSCEMQQITFDIFMIFG